MRLKKEITNILSEKKYDELIKQSSNTRRVLTMLISMTYDKDSVISWRAMEAIGLITGRIAGTDPDMVKSTTGRLMWMIRDESGGIGWSAPEILGEIVRNNPLLCADIATIIVSFHEEIMLTAGVMRAAGRMGKTHTEMVDYAGPIIVSCLNNQDRSIRGYAAWAAGELGVALAADRLESLRSDTDSILFYEKEELINKTVGELAGAALAKIEPGNLVKA
ncbi:MAG: DVU0298 family protein [Nitrospirota bacterium]